ncbi:hypothetical protein V492_02515 [Pseudogymnoascus sp. VKM F-4246]|nr:hypothetical protein V492_02515 [Pseudogymnoascus sp. VKM F-4246]
MARPKDSAYDFTAIKFTTLMDITAIFADAHGGCAQLEHHRVDVVGQPNGGMVDEGDDETGKIEDDSSRRK